MTVGELIRLLRRFPPQFLVFFSPDDAGQLAMVPRDAVMNLVDPSRLVVLPDDDDAADLPQGFVDSVVIYPRIVSTDD